MSFFFFLSLVLVLSLSQGAEFDLDQAKKFVHFSGAAYCAHPRFKKEQIENWSCHACEEYPGMIATPFTSDRDCNGFVGYYPDDNEIVIGFSGTDPLNIQMWIDDLDFRKTDYPLCSDIGCQVHEGFYKTYLSAVDIVRNLTEYYMTEFPATSITCTGHSLGAALASLCAADMNDFFSGADMSSPYTFGLPRVGDDTFAEWYKSASLPDAYRVVHRKDPVPHVPTMSMGFHHFPYEIFYVNDYSDYTVCSANGEDDNCSNKYSVDLDIFNHLHYIGFDFITNFANCEL